HALTATTGATVSLIPTAAADYLISVVASDGVLSSSPATVVVSVAPAGTARPPAPPLVTPLAAHLEHAAGTLAQVSLSATSTAADGSPATIQVAAASGSPTGVSPASIAGGVRFSTTTDAADTPLVTAVDA